MPKDTVPYMYTNTERLATILTSDVALTGGPRNSSMCGCGSSSFMPCQLDAGHSA